MKVITIGKSRTCDIVVNNDYVSRVHAEMSLENGQYIFRDTSSNGTTVNGRTINNREVVVNPNDRILLANQVQLPWAQVYALLPQGQTPYEKVDTEEDLSAILAIISFLIPLVGFILYFCWKDKTPYRAKKAGKIALIGFGINLFIAFASSL